MTAAQINLDTWENTAENRQMWRPVVKAAGLKKAEQSKYNLATTHRAAEKLRTPRLSGHIFPKCAKDCHFQIGLFNHCKACR